MLIPRQPITEFLDKKASKKAEQLVRINRTSSALEIQSPSEEESKIQIEILKRELLEKIRDSLWNQNQIKK
jgi:hypothetical protein